MPILQRLVLPLLLLLVATAPSDAQWRYSHNRYQWKRTPSPTPQPPPTPDPVPQPPPTPDPTPAPSLSVADQIAADMGVNEGHPHGVPLSWDFANHSYVQNGNTPGSNRAAVQWGVIYVDANGSSATNTRVNIRSCEIYWKQASTGSWILGTKTDRPQIESYAEDFSSGPFSANVRNESDGSVSTVTSAGRNVHFYPSRFAILNDIAGWAGVCQMRLILNNGSGPDDRTSAHFLGETGADYYPSTSGPGISNNPAIAGGKYKYVTNDWRSFAFTTLSKAALESNPPPIDLSGVLP